MVGSITNVFIGICSCFGSQIKPFFIRCQRRKFVDHFIPFQTTLLSHTLTPLLGGLHGKMPVRKFERRINCFCSTQRFLCRNGTFQYVTSFQFIVCSKRVHKFCSLLYQTIIFLQHFFSRISTIK